MKKSLMRSLLFGGAAIAGVFLFAQTAAAVSGPCSGCHTMHNSQDGVAVGTSVAQQTLLKDTCIGCHSRADTASAINSVSLPAPAVMHTTGAATSGAARVTGDSYLAGGSFRWVETTGPGYGHNVSDLTAAPAEIAALDGIPPGDTGGAYATGTQITCLDSGAGGFTGCHYSGGHHSNTGSTYAAAGTDTEFVDGTSVGASYRFLSGGTKGGENSDWEHTFASNDHNIYAASTVYTGGTAGSLTTVCIRCHGDFHGLMAADLGAGTGAAQPWYRHPTDLALDGAGVASEHAAYGTYDPTVPIAASVTPASGTVTGATWDDWDAMNDTAGFNTITCVSCHRAHGSEYLDALRWSYGEMLAGAGSGGWTTGPGCFKCHSDKD